MKHNSTILKKISILFCLIILPMILLTSGILFWSNQKLTKKNLQTYTQKSQTFVNNLDDKFRQIYNLANSTLSYSKVERLAYTSQIMSRYEKAQAINLLVEYIGDIKMNNDMIKNIKVYVHSTLQAYNANYNELGYCVDITEEEYQKIVSLSKMIFSGVNYENGRFCMLLKSTNYNPASVVEIEFSANQLKKEFDRQNEYEKTWYYFDFKEGEFVLDNLEDEELRRRVLSTDYGNGSTNFVIDGERYYVVRFSFENIDASYIQIIPGSVLVEPRHMSNLFSVFWVIIMSACVFIFFVGVIRMIHKPLGKLVGAFERAEKGDLSTRIKETEKSEFDYLYKGFNDMADHLESLISEVYEQKMLVQKAEFKQLQAQINPHFLYNSFFMLQGMIKNNQREEAVKVSTELGIYFKYITRNQGDFVYLKDEYLHANIYANIQTLRFEGRIRTQFGELPKAYEYFEVPRLILQPIIENAYNYGLENKCSDGLLRVGFQDTEEGLNIVMEDNGNELSDERLYQIQEKLRSAGGLTASDEITGLSNICKRIQIFYKNNSTLMVSRSELGGLKVTVFLEKGDRL